MRSSSKISRPKHASPSRRSLAGSDQHCNGLVLKTTAVLVKLPNSNLYGPSIIIGELDQSEGHKRLAQNTSKPLPPYIAVG